jgi:Asp-tRNA(Asn)/Glu-tRNA(Gln) amidotransferase A subunit family amidase
METADLSIAAMGRALRDGSVTSEQLTRDALSRIGTHDAGMRLFC